MQTIVLTSGFTVMGQSIFLLTLKVLYYDQELRSLTESGEFRDFLN